ncbi:MAG: GAF domain-containing protein [Candidatus Atribacteria bacterium]|nr:GAF domain-containing protein [Candidatus Atribacteria bacterium]
MKKRKNWTRLIKEKLYLNRNKKIRRQNINNVKSNSTSSEELPKQQKNWEEFFKQRRREYLNLFKGCPIALLYTDIDGIILSVNHYFEELTGFLEEELKGKALAHCLRPKEQSFFDSGSKNSFEAAIFSKNHSRIEVLVRWAWNQIDNRYAGVIFSFQDISGLRRERKIKQILFRISEITHSGLPLVEIYPQIHAQLKNIIVATNFYIALWDIEQEQFHFPYYRDEAAGDDEIFILRYCSTQSIFYYTLKLAKPVLMDFQRYRKMLSHGFIEPWDVMTNTHLWLAVPLKLEQRVFGVIALQSYNNARLYSEKDIGLLEFVAQQISTAIGNKEIGGKRKKSEECEKREVENREKAVPEIENIEKKERELESKEKEKRAKTQQLCEQQIEQERREQEDQERMAKERAVQEKIRQEQEMSEKAAQEQELKEQILKEKEPEEHRFKEQASPVAYQKKEEQNQDFKENSIQEMLNKTQSDSSKETDTKIKKDAENKPPTYQHPTIEFLTRTRKNKPVLGSRFRENRNK